MPTIQVYVNQADRAWLDEQPEHFTAAALMRDAIARARRNGEECRHDDQVLVCLGCNRRQHVQPLDSPSTGDGDIDAQTGGGDVDTPSTRPGT